MNGPAGAALRVDVEAGLVLVQEPRPLDVELPVLYFELAVLFSFVAGNY